MATRTADSLLTLRAEVDARWPGRSKASDGFLASSSHTQANPNSDHEPWVKDGATGVVTAGDFTDDAVGGTPEIADVILRTLVERRDPRVKYIIHEGKIWRSYDKPGIPAWTPGPYTGSNQHFQHVHVSVLPEKRLYDSMVPWGLLDKEPAKPAPKPTSLVSRDFAITGIVNMHAVGPEDERRARRMVRRTGNLEWTIGALAEFNRPMAKVVREEEKLGLHRAEPNEGTTGNALFWRQPVWDFNALPDLDVKIPGRWLHMAAGVFVHKRTGFVLPKLALHNPPSVGKAAEADWVRDLCVARELAWARKMKREHGRASLDGDFNEARAINLPNFKRLMHHKVDEGYANGTISAKDQEVHFGFVRGDITDHAAVSVPIDVRVKH